MPTDFKSQSHLTVHLTKKNPACSWKRHFQKGSALLEVMRVLVKLAANDPVNHYVYATPKAIAKLCTGKFRKGKNRGKPLDITTVEKCLKCLEKLSIVSRELLHSPDVLGKPLRGRVIVPHEKLCERYARVCRYVGPGKKGVWVPTPGGQVLVADEFADIEDGGAYVVPEEKS